MSNKSVEIMQEPVSVSEQY